MQQHLKGNECANPKCNKKVVHATGRYMDETPNNCTPYHRWARKTMIGRTFFHEDGTLCDESLYSVKKLQKSAFLHLGDSKRDPRN